MNGEQEAESHGPGFRLDGRPYTTRDYARGPECPRYANASLFTTYGILVMSPP
jgi:hypothetical protein